MMVRMCAGTGVWVLMWLVLCAVAQAEGDDAAAKLQEYEERSQHPLLRYPKRLRVHGSLGLAQRAKSGDALSLGTSAGVQLMLPANAMQSYGIGIDYVQTAARNARRYMAAGLFAENRLFGWFLTSIGAVAYVPLAETRPVPFGISTKLGWAPDLYDVINPFVIFRSDWIFGKRIQGMTSVDIGLTLLF